MRVRVAYTVDASDDYRMALRHHWGQCGTLATRAEVRQEAEVSGESNGDDLMYEWQNCETCQDALRERSGE